MAYSVRFARFGLFAVVMVLLSSLAVLGGRAMDRQRTAPEPAPEFVLRRLSGELVSLGNLRGKIVVLFFSDWNSPATNDYFQRVVDLADNYADTDAVRVFTVETGVSDKMDPGELRVFKSVIGQRFPMLLDTDLSVSSAYGVKVTPTVIVIDQQGMIRYHGAFDDNRDPALVKERYCEDAIESLLARRSLKWVSTQAFGCPIRRPK